MLYNLGITVITSHINADFDAIGSMIAAQKLYPNSVIVFHGSYGKTVRDFFLQSVVYLLNITEFSKVDIEKVVRLVIVDTRKKNRIGNLLSLLDKEGIEVHIYDHHIKQKNDIKATKDIYMNTGSTVTILTNIIRKKKIFLSPEEATIMCVGIYEDTGSFMFPSTTVHDFKAASFLLSSGANLQIISSIMAKEFSPKQIELLNDMIHSMNHHNINGFIVNIIKVALDEYFPNLAFLVNKIMQIKRVEILFAIVLMGSKINIIARSKEKNVNVGKIMEIIGGGGHKSAATATFKNKTLAQTEQLLIKILSDEIKSKYSAQNIMSFPAIIVGKKITCKEAKSYLVRYNINALIVTRDGTSKTPIVGYITLQILEKALFHGLGNVHVHEYMVTEFGFVKKNANLDKIKQKIIMNKQRILPVIDEYNKISGVITRTNLLNILTHDNERDNTLIPKPYQEDSKTRTKFITRFMKERISKKYIEAMIKLGEIANTLGYNVYVVGGFVRDLFLYRKNKDIDLVVEGNGILLAETYAKKNNVRVHIHKKFFTATIIISNDFRIDIASSRVEYYEFPASLPIVEMSSIKMDLFRRDFTINALAIQLNPGHFGRLIDFFSGQRDIKHKVIRVIHNISFVEDPTRVFRALKFEQRYDFKIGKLTYSLIKNAVKMGLFERLSGQRFFNEFKLILEEENPVHTIIKLFEHGLMKTIMPEQEDKISLKYILTLTKSVLDWQNLLFIKETYERWAVYFMIIIRNHDKSESCFVCKKMALLPKYKTMFCSMRFKAIKHLESLETDAKLLNSKVYNILSKLKTEIILYMMITTKSEKVKEQISHYQTKLRNINLIISGKDLAKMGLESGPRYQYILDKLLMAKLDEKIKSKKEELDLAKKMIT